MRVFVDTTVWVVAMRSRSAPESLELGALLLDDRVALALPVRLELLAGASRSDRPRLRRALSALPVYVPSASSWTKVEEWVETAADRDQRFGIADLLIAAVAAEEGGSIWSLDDDFRRMVRLGFCRLHEVSRPA